MPSKRSNEEFLNIVNKKFPQIKVLSRYVNSTTKIECRCLTCGYQWLVSPTTLLVSKCGCPRCSGKMRKTHEEFIGELAVKNPNVLILGQYKNANTKVKCRCKICNNEWDMRPIDLLHNHGCPRCANKGTSFLERFVYNSFRCVYPKYKVYSRYTKTINMELDIYIPHLRLAIEPGSWYWHKSKIENDTKKRKICKENGITLITIYDCYPYIRKPYRNNCYTSSLDLGRSENLDELKNIITKIYEEQGLNVQKLNDCFEKIYQKAIVDRNSFNYLERIQKIAPSIEIMEPIYSRDQKVLFKCKKCGYNWKTRASVIINGHGCPNCKGTAKKDTATFIKELEQINPNIIILGEYRSAIKPIKCKCRICSHVWEPTPHKLLLGRGCPKCSIIKQRKTDEKFKNELFDKFNYIEVLGEYETNQIPITVKCLKCGKIWTIKPINLLHGKGCSNCSRKNK